MLAPRCPRGARSSRCSAGRAPGASSAQGETLALSCISEMTVGVSCTSGGHHVTVHVRQVHRAAASHSYSEARQLRRSKTGKNQSKDPCPPVSLPGAFSLHLRSVSRELCRCALPSLSSELRGASERPPQWQWRPPRERWPRGR